MIPSPGDTAWHSTTQDFRLMTAIGTSLSRLQLLREDSVFSTSTAQHSTVWHMYCEATLRNLSNRCGHNQRVVCCNDTIGIDARAGLLIRLQQGTAPASD